MLFFKVSTWKLWSTRISHSLSGMLEDRTRFDLFGDTVSVILMIAFLSLFEYLTERTL